MNLKHHRVIHPASFSSLKTLKSLARSSGLALVEMANILQCIPLILQQSNHLGYVSKIAEALMEKEGQVKHQTTIGPDDPLLKTTPMNLPLALKSEAGNSVPISHMRTLEVPRSWRSFWKASFIKLVANNEGFRWKKAYGKNLVFSYGSKIYVLIFESKPTYSVLELGPVMYPRNRHFFTPEHMFSLGVPELTCVDNRVSPRDDPATHLVECVEPDSSLASALNSKTSGESPCLRMANFRKLAELSLQVNPELLRPAKKLPKRRAFMLDPPQANGQPRAQKRRSKSPEKRLSTYTPPALPPENPPERLKQYDIHGLGLTCSPPAPIIALGNNPKESQEELVEDISAPGCTPGDALGLEVEITTVVGGFSLPSGKSVRSPVGISGVTTGRGSRPPCNDEEKCKRCGQRFGRHKELISHVREKHLDITGRRRRGMFSAGWRGSRAKCRNMETIWEDEEDEENAFEEEANSEYMAVDMEFEEDDMGEEVWVEFVEGA